MPRHAGSNPSATALQIPARPKLCVTSAGVVVTKMCAAARADFVASAIAAPGRIREWKIANRTLAQDFDGGA